MSTLLNFGRDIQGNNAFAPVSATDKYKVNLAAATAASITVPSNKQTWIAVFSYMPGSTVWVDFSGATAAGPATGSFVTTTSELLPASRTVEKGSTISVISADANTQVGVSLYAISYP